LVAEGHRTVDAEEHAYSGVVAPEAIHLGMFAAIHNGLKVIAADIGNAYLHAKSSESFIPFLEMTMESCQVFDKGLYGLESSGARFHEHLVTS